MRKTSTFRMTLFALDQTRSDLEAGMKDDLRQYQNVIHMKEKTPSLSPRHVDAPKFILGVNAPLDAGEQ
jgi:hypothetical protein